ncbi:uncharacterized protein CPUR_03363 [Claviceps purpurea 20.1]|uniref:Uncharacterized protein n=1 Tax=Claviceps purpurea (strain 20.1) TaxID=1111077 RepID=M1W0I6_CLAP2|nr:uncharacterized protein CPUR_03363 [Claviceps purpurea 20.1]
MKTQIGFSSNMPMMAFASQYRLFGTAVHSEQ